MSEEHTNNPSTAAALQSHVSVKRATLVGGAAGLVACVASSLVFVAIGERFGPVMTLIGGPLIGAWIGVVVGWLCRLYQAPRPAGGGPSRPTWIAIAALGVFGSLAAAMSLFVFQGKGGVFQVANFVIDMGYINVVLIGLTVAFDSFSSRHERDGGSKLG